jgi:decaprenylphospho-beta-D-erythro-pentofuranosid-2-ulose 2-reductase
VAAVRGRPSDYAYAGAKAGLDSFFQGLGDRLADSGVQVMVVRPGFVPTKMTAHRSAPAWSTTPDAVAEQIVRGLERDARVVWAPPRLRWVMAGVRLIPRPLYRRMTAAAERRGRL